MSLLVIGVSHRSASMDIVERASVPTDRYRGLLADISAVETVSEAVLVSTCNRVEIYAEVTRFHVAVTEIGRLLAEQVGAEVGELAEHLYVHYDEPAVTHLFRVAAGLDSMVIGETQILGQLRAAYARAQEDGSIGRRLHAVVQRALRTGRRVQAETGIAGAGASLVGVALDEVDAQLGSLVDRRALVIGAGSMGALAATSLRRKDIGALWIASRTHESAARLASAQGGSVAGFTDLPEQVRAADLIISATGAAGTVLDTPVVAEALLGRDGRRLVVVDLALPRDVAAGVGQLDGVELLDLTRLQDLASLRPEDADLCAAQAIVAAEVAGLLAEQRADQVAPLIAALRGRAQEIVDVELARVTGRLPELRPEDLATVDNALRRVADKLLHQPTVRMKELVAGPAGASYAPVLQALLGLDAERLDLADALAVDARLPDSAERSATGEPTNGSAADQARDTVAAILQEYRP